MAKFISLRLIWLPKGTFNNMARTIMILFSGSQDCLYSYASFYGCYALMAPFSVDIKNVLLYGDLAEEVYMEQPPVFVAHGESGLVCKLRRSLYGPK